MRPSVLPFPMSEYVVKRRLVQGRRGCYVRSLSFTLRGGSLVADRCNQLNDSWSALPTFRKQYHYMSMPLSHTYMRPCVWLRCMLALATHVEHTRTGGRLRTRVRGHRQLGLVRC